MMSTVPPTGTFLPISRMAAPCGSGWTDSYRTYRMGKRNDTTEWLPEEDAYLSQRLAEGWPARKIAATWPAQFPHRTQGAITNRKSALGLRTNRDILPTPADAPVIDPVQAELDRRERVRSLREEREALAAIAGEKGLRAMLEGLTERIAPKLSPPPKYVPPKRGRMEVSRETVVQKFSDWHAGENVSAEATRGFNEFNDTILRQRVQRVVDTHLSIKRRAEAGGGWLFERLVIAANGDFVSGTIHELERHSDHENVVWAVYETGLLLADVLRQFAAEYPLVEVFCTSGNHGRLPDARRIQQKDPTRSWDTLVYLFAKTALANVPNVRFEIPNSYSAAFDVYDWRFLQTHGHDVKSWNSIPWYGLNRLVGNINALEAGRGTPIHYWLFGHFHNPSSLPHATGESFVNGSIVGANEFALNALGKADRPTQWMLQVHPENGVTGRWPLFAGPMPGRR